MRIPAQPPVEIVDYAVISREEASTIHKRMEDKIPMWIVYNQQTTDYPGRFVARMHASLPDTQTSNVIILADSLQEIHARLPYGVVMLQPNHDDDPNILEIWL